MPPDPIWPKLFILIVLILINAFFAASEIAVISLSESKLKRQADEGDKKARKLLPMVQKPGSFLSTIQIGVTLSGLLASAVAASSFAEPIVSWLVEGIGITAVSPGTLNTVAIIIITLVLSYFSLVFGELIPKRIAMQKSEPVARFCCGVVSALSAVFRPVGWVLSKSCNAVLRLLGIDPNADGEDVSEDEIRLMVDIGEEKGAIEPGEKELIENIFEFNNMTAEEVMIHRTDVAMIWAEDKDEDIIRVIEQTGLSRFPVYNEDADDIVGILNTRDFLLNARANKPKKLKNLLRPAYFVPESVRTDVLFRNMQSKKVHMAIVVDEYGGTSGLVTMEDLLEEIVGNIYDEFDPQVEQEVLQLEENLWRVAGGVDLERLGKALGLVLPEPEEYDTLGGLVFTQLSAIPEDGSHVEVEVCGLHIRVEELTDRRVEWALVSKLDAGKSELTGQ